MCIRDSSNETSRTESEMMGDSICSTPALTKRVEENDIIRMMKLLFNEQRDVYKRQAVCHSTR